MMNTFLMQVMKWRICDLVIEVINSWLSMMAVVLSLFIKNLWIVFQWVIILSWSWMPVNFVMGSDCSCQYCVLLIYNWLSSLKVLHLLHQTARYTGTWHSRASVLCHRCHVLLQVLCWTLVSEVIPLRKCCLWWPFCIAPPSVFWLWSLHIA